MEDSLNSDSIINLTKPGLYSIYNGSKNNLSKEIDDNEIYSDLSLNINKTNSNADDIGSGNGKKTVTGRKENNMVRISSKLMTLGVCGIVYQEIAKHIHDNHILVPQLAAEPLIIGNDLIIRLLSNYNIRFSNSVYSYVITMLEGVCLGLIQPIADYYLPSSFSNNYDSNNLNFNEIIRAFITLLGVSFGVRKIQWSSSVQVALAWSLLNPCLWLLLDNTTSGFITSTLTAFAASFLVYWYNPTKFSQLSINSNDSYNQLAIWLWLGSFFFCGLIIFGKLGRVLFKF